MYYKVRVIKQMAENEHVKPQVWLPIEYKAEIAPDTGTGLFSDDQ